MTNEKIANYRPTELSVNKPLAHSMANLFYWLSFFLLLVAMRMIIDPSNRKAGTLGHIYITLGSFEVYMWLLLTLGRWQLIQKLKVDAIRSFCFMLVLCGFFFMVLNELYAATKYIKADYLIRTAYSLTVIGIASTVIKIVWMCNISNIKLSGMQKIFALGWLAMTAGPAPLFESLSDGPRYIGAIMLCWVIAAYLAGHLVLVKQQQLRGFAIDKENIFKSWPVGWIVIALLFVCAVGQAAAVTYVFAGWAFWYFSPIFITMAIVLICLTKLARFGQPLAWAVLLASLLFMLMVASDHLPKGFPKDNSIWLLMHPVYPAIAWGSITFALAAITISCWWLLIFAFIAPISGIIVKCVKELGQAKNGKGYAVLLLAFLLLGGGALLQWAQEKWGNGSWKNQLKPEIPNEPIPSSVNNIVETKTNNEDIINDLTQ
ncbi:MAG: hypothetical protein JEZ07_09130 [Phycisphaerae bacterium]|nr:hypothetical protein [Phycisphaerae bacterium]